MNTIIQKEFSDLVIDLAFVVHKALGPGLLEIVYEKALSWEFRNANIPFTRQQVFPLFYKGDYISSYFADLGLTAARLSLEYFHSVKNSS